MPIDPWSLCTVRQVEELKAMVGCELRDFYGDCVIVCYNVFLCPSIYVKVKPYNSLLTGFAQVIVPAWKNRHLPLPPKNSDIWHFRNGSNLVQPTDKVSLLKVLEQSLHNQE
ncbi:hypothetical protein AAZX31_05G214700 [Glycine max]|uniref:uncharacterized protein LOC114411581 n=1 Tax=Glycine soja TaxID=3848 RepID=UPI001039BD04|nr:uncharacterized protein LOC114411581 [Glycine soja]